MTTPPAAPPDTAPLTAPPPAAPPAANPAPQPAPAPANAAATPAPLPGPWPLDNQQRAAAAEELGPLLILGGPGAGKTHTLVGRILRLLESGVPPQTITYVTFGARIADQVRHELSTATAAANIFVGTLHHYASFFLRQAGAAVIGISPYYSIWDHQQAAEAIAELGREANDPELKFGPDEVERFLHWKGFNQARHDGQPVPPPTGSWHDMLTRYAQEKFRQHTLDLDDIIPHAVYALEANPDLRKTWAQIRTRHLLVDEFQDITPVQYRLINLMTGPEGSIAIATDPNQSIYTWRGANPRLMKQFQLDHPRNKQHLLTLNHRSTRTLTDLSSQLTRHPEVDGLVDSGLQSIRPAADRPQIIYFDGTQRQMDAFLTEQMLYCNRQEQVPWDQMALIFRRHATGNRLRAQLLQTGIPHTLLSETMANDEDDAQHLLGLLTCLVNPMDTQAFALAAGADDRRQRRRLSELHGQNILELAHRLGQDLPAAARQYQATQSRNSPVYRSLDYAVNALQALREYLQDPDATVPGLCRQAHARLHQFRRPGELPPPPNPALARLFITADTSRRLPDENREQHLARFLETARSALQPEHRALENADPLDQDKGVALATVHAAKGLQWPWVWVVDAADHIMPGPVDPNSPNLQSRLEEEQRLFYVAATRATDHLAFYCAANSFKNEPAYPSRFLEPIEDTADYRRIAAERGADPADPIPTNPATVQATAPAANPAGQ